MSIRFHLPLFFSHHETLIYKKLNETNQLKRSEKEYNALIELKRHASRMSESIHQLKEISLSAYLSEEKCHQFEKIVAVIIEKKLQSAVITPEEIHRCKNSFTNLRLDFEDHNLYMKIDSAVTIVTHSIATMTAGVGLFLAGVMATGPMGAIFLGFAMAAVCSAVLLIGAYNLYAEGRFLAGKQMKEIDNALDYLFPADNSADFDAEDLEEAERNLRHYAPA